MAHITRPDNVYFIFLFIWVFSPPLKYKLHKGKAFVLFITLCLAPNWHSVSIWGRNEALASICGTMADTYSECTIHQPVQTPQETVTIIFLILMRRELWLEKVKYLPTITQLESKGAGIWTGICSPSEPKLLTPRQCSSYEPKVLLPLLPSTYLYQEHNMFKELRPHKNKNALV